MANESDKIEFNSMTAVLRRLDGITYRINAAKNQYDTKGMLDALIDYYKEISPELKDDEDDIWKWIKSMKKHVPDSKFYTHWKVLDILDEIDRQLRKLAKKHGFLTTNKKDPRKAILE